MALQAPAAAALSAVAAAASSVSPFCPVAPAPLASSAAGSPAPFASSAAVSPAPLASSAAVAPAPLASSASVAPAMLASSASASLPPALQLVCRPRLVCCCHRRLPWLPSPAALCLPHILTQVTDNRLIDQFLLLYVITTLSCYLNVASNNNNNIAFCPKQVGVGKKCSIQQ